jgi:ACS family allantoate permease-like MFS transporter
LYFVAWATGNIIGPQTFRADQAPAYTGGTIAMIVCYLVAMCCISAYGYICRRSNARRESDIAAATGTQDWLDMTDGQMPGFKYTT